MIVVAGMQQIRVEVEAPIPQVKVVIPIQVVHMKVKFDVPRVPGAFINQNFVLLALFGRLGVAEVDFRVRDFGDQTQHFFVGLGSWGEDQPFYSLDQILGGRLADGMIFLVESLDRCLEGFQVLFLNFRWVSSTQLFLEETNYFFSSF